jgi:hypothetical protein
MPQVNKLHREFAMALRKHHLARAAERLIAAERLMASYDTRFAGLISVNTTISNSARADQFALNHQQHNTNRSTTTACSTMPCLQSVSVQATSATAKPVRPLLFPQLEERLQTAKKDFVTLVQALLRDCVHVMEPGSEHVSQCAGLILIQPVSALSMFFCFLLTPFECLCLIKFHSFFFFLSNFLHR